MLGDHRGLVLAVAFPVAQAFLPVPQVPRGTRLQCLAAIATSFLFAVSLVAPGILRTVRVPMELAEPALLPLAIRTAGLRPAMSRCPTVWLLRVGSSDPKP